MADKSGETKKPRSAIYDLLSVVGVVVVGFLAIESYHRWKKSNLRETNPLQAAEDELANLHHERTIAVSKLSTLKKHASSAPKLEIRLDSLGAQYAAEIVNWEEKFADQRDRVRALGGRWVLFAPEENEVIEMTDQRRIEHEQRAAFDRTRLLKQLAETNSALKPRVDRLVERYEQEIEYWDKQLQSLQSAAH